MVSCVCVWACMYACVRSGSLTMWSGSAEPWSHHELREDGRAAAAGVGALQHDGAAGPRGHQQRAAVPEGDQSEGPPAQDWGQDTAL